MALSLPSLAELRDTQADIYRFRERVVAVSYTHLTLPTK
jgi:hypothetical protein